jgi:hypothetical protein
MAGTKKNGGEGEEKEKRRGERESKAADAAVDSQELGY